MESFLQRIAGEYLKTYGAEFGKMAFIFPNRRAGLFFRKYLTELCETSIPVLEVMSLHDLVFRLANKKEADRFRMLFTLFTFYTKKSGSKETFDEFFYWGEMLLGDFDEIDKHLIDARTLFNNVTDLRKIDTDYSFLSPSQVEAIRSFWTSFQPKGEGGHNEQDFLAVWKILYELYTALRKHLAAEGTAYEGMAYREIAERADELSPETIGFERLVFVGLYGLTPAETRLVESLKRIGIGEEIKEEITEGNFGEIEIVGVPSGIGQAKYVYSLLSNWAKEGKVEGEDALRTAIVLPDESLLVPLLNAIPEEISQVNVTMGYPLANTAAATLVNALLSLQSNVRKIDENSVTFYHEDVDSVLSHPYIRMADSEEADAARRDILQGNKVRVSVADVARTPLLADIFSPLNKTAEWGSYLTAILLRFINIVPSGEDSEAVSLYHSTLVRLNDIIRRSSVALHGDTYRRLLRRAIDTVKIPFSGEPLAGLQIMGVLETRTLNFDRLVILSMNEGVFPPRRNDNTFIPYNLRRGFGLPTGEQRDRLWAHHFYRLLGCARQVSLIYDTRTGDTHTGEVSRFIHQLRYHYEHPLRDRRVVYPIAVSPNHTLIVKKNKTVLFRLDNFLDEGKSSLSASAINIYLDCPLHFYFSVVEGTTEENLVNESVESNIFGSILHDTLQRIYEPFCNRDLDSATLHNLAGNHRLLEQAIAKAFAKVFFRTPDIRPLTGQNYLIAQMIRKYVIQVLIEDARIAPFRYLASELRLESHFPLSDDRQVRLKGFIDRVDTVGGGIRIVDYKSGGSNELIIPSYEALFDSSLRKRPKEAMQVLLYAWMYLRQPIVNRSVPLYAEIYYMRKLFTSPFTTALKFRSGYNKTVPLGEYLPHEAPFEEMLRACLDEIFSPSVPFTPTSDPEHCRYCPFSSVCR
ncbi:MAG: PD-(D/E)XK nuclease family protein [Tannerellaceae bacterium]|jgi:hypothetical protein|nr:PD-(D/E)XK nuclease family protein [Tannerellaceae bacterium]